MSHPFDTASFLSIWYWGLSVLVWTRVTGRALGVPHDMLLRAARLPEVAARVDVLAHITAERARGIAGTAGPFLAALAGFCLAALAVLGFVFQIELARALTPLAFPLALIAARTARLAEAVKTDDLRGEALRRRLSRHRAMNQVIAVLALFAAALLAVQEQPRFFPR